MIENTSTIEKENNGSNGGVKKKVEERERVIEGTVREKRNSEVYERRDER